VGLKRLKKRPGRQGPVRDLSAGIRTLVAFLIWLGRHTQLRAAPTKENLVSDCIFCKIARGELKSEILREDDQAVAFRDINSQAPTHILIIPKKHIPTLAEASEQEGDLLGHLLLMARQIASDEKLDSGFRVVLNNGVEAGQSVFHIHLHLLGGRVFDWPPG
jgi:histidine triad (HIT) family protein